MIGKDGIADKLRQIKGDSPRWNIPRSVSGAAGILLLAALTSSAISAQAPSGDKAPVASTAPLEVPLPPLPSRQPLSEMQPAAAQDGWIVGLAPDAKIESLGLNAVGDFKEYPQVAKGPRFGVLHSRNGQLSPAERLSVNRQNGVLYVEPNFIVRLDEPAPAAVKAPRSAATTPNDPMLVSEWWARALNLSQVWPTATSSTLGITDTGCDVAHPDLPPIAVDDQIDVTSGMLQIGSVSDPVGHGTAIEGIMAMVPNNGIGGVGVDWAPRRIVCIKIANSMTTSVANLVLGIEVATQRGVKFLNVSWVSSATSPLRQSVVNYLSAGDSYLFAACGNYSGTGCMYPAAYSKDPDMEGLVSVAALDTNMKLAYFSNSGADFIAPGYNICTTWPAAVYSSMYGCGVGTSFSSPMEMAVAAVAHDGNGKDMTRTNFINFLKTQANKLGNGFYDPVYGWGMLDWRAMWVSHPSTIFFPVISRQSTK